MPFTYYDARKKVEDFKKSKDYKGAIEFLTEAIEEQKRKRGVRALTKVDKELTDRLTELKTLRFAQCLDEAQAYIVVDSADQGKKERPLAASSLDFYQKAKTLLLEARTIKETPELDLALKKVECAISLVETYEKGQGLLHARCLNRAKECFSSLVPEHPDASSRLQEIEGDLATCRELKDRFSLYLEKKDFFGARKELEALRKLNKDDEDCNRLIQEVMQKEKAERIVEFARASKDSDDTAVLYQALNRLKEARGIEPNETTITELEREIKNRIGKIKYDKGLLYRDKQRDIDKAIASFKEIEKLGISVDDSTGILKVLLETNKKIESLYQRGISCGGDLEEAIAAFAEAKSFGFVYRDLNERLQKAQADLKGCRAKLAEAVQLMEENDLDKAVARAQSVLILYSGYREARDLLNRAQKLKEIKAHLERAKGYLYGKEFRYREALKEIADAIKADPENADAENLRQEVFRKTLERLTGKVKTLDESRHLTEAIKLIQEVSKDITLSRALQETLSDLEKREGMARKFYQDGFGKLNEARSAGIAEEVKRGGLYQQAETLFRDSLNANADLVSIVQPELESLEKERGEWRAWLEARRLFERKDFEKCLEVLSPYKEIAMLKETNALIVDVLNEMGFSGSFTLKAEGTTYTIIPEDAVFVGRNTTTFGENHVPLRLGDISRKHGKISRLGGKYFYEDRDGCHHGTKLNGKVFDRQVQLKDRDLLGYGFFKADNGSPTEEKPATSLKVWLYQEGTIPTLKLTLEPVEQEDFCEDTTRVYILLGDTLSIGRGMGNAIVLKDQSVANEHVVIHRQENRYMIEDLGTPGGSFVNNTPIKGSQTLRLGDTIKTGHVEMLVEQLK